MDRTDFEQNMVDVIVEQLVVERDKVISGASFKDNLGADSVDQANLIMEIEEKFNVEITDEEAEKIKTVQDAFDCVWLKIQC